MKSMLYDNYYIFFMYAVVPVAQFSEQVIDAVKMTAGVNQ